MKRIFVFSILILGMVSCKKPSTNPTNDYDRGPLLVNMGENIIIPSLNAAALSADSLKIAIDHFVSLPNAATLQDLKLKFSNAYYNFQKVSPYEFGPSENEVLRGTANTFPTDSNKINSAIVNGAWDLDVLTFADAIGFPAMDFLIFGSSESVVIQNFTSDLYATHRGAFLKDLIRQYAFKINSSLANWQVTGGDYLSSFIGKTGTDVGSSTSLLVNALNKHFERYLRDGKIGIPVGVRTLGIAIPEKCEAYYSGISLSLAQENLRAIERMYLGNSLDGTQGTGFDNYLIAIDAADLDASIQNQINITKMALDGLSDPLSQNIINNQSQVELAYAEFQKLIILFKVEMPSRLGVLIAYQDTDGD